MRRLEAQYRLGRSPAIWEQFFKEFRDFEEILRKVPAETELKQALLRRVQDYASTLAQWNRYNQNIQRTLREIAGASQQLIPQAHAILGTAQAALTSAAAALAASQSRTSLFIILVGCSAVLIGLAFMADRAQHHAAADGLAQAMTRLARAIPPRASLPPRPGTNSVPWRAPSSCSATPCSSASGWRRARPSQP